MNSIAEIIANLNIIGFFEREKGKESRNGPKKNKTIYT
jgi:hypothetical protein